jgi:hypothetical protein
MPVLSGLRLISGLPTRYGGKLKFVTALAREFDKGQFRLYAPDYLQIISRSAAKHLNFQNIENQTFTMVERG